MNLDDVILLLQEHHECPSMESGADHRRLTAAIDTVALVAAFHRELLQHIDAILAHSDVGLADIEAVLRNVMIALRP